MSAILQKVKAKVDELVREGDALLGFLSDRGNRLWDRIGYDRFLGQYHPWYSACLALTEANMPSRAEEMRRAHQGEKGHKGLRDGVLKVKSVGLGSLDTDTGDLLHHHVTHIKGIVSSIPSYMESSLYSVELAVAERFVGDLLAEAEYLLKASHVRAAGAVAGVLLERHLKTLCDRHVPPISYTAKAAIAKVNDLLRDGNVYDLTQWRKVQWMGDIRNKCDHAGTDDPRHEDVADLIADVKKFVARFDT